MMCIYIVKNRLREVVLIGSRLTWLDKKAKLRLCKKVLVNVQHQMKQLLEQNDKNKKRKMQEQFEESNTFNEDLVRIVEDLRRTPKSSVSAKSQKGKNTPRVDDYFMPITTPRAQPSLKSVLQSKEVVEKLKVTTK